MVPSAKWIAEGRSPTWGFQQPRQHLCLQQLPATAACDCCSSPETLPCRMKLQLCFPSLGQRFIIWEVRTGISMAGKRLEGKLRQHQFRSRCPSQSLLGSFWLLRSLLSLQLNLAPAPGHVSSELMAGPAAVQGHFTLNQGILLS